MSEPRVNDAVSYAYDEIGRVLKRTVDASPETFTFDAVGRVSSHASPLGTFNLAYLGQTGQLLSQQIASGMVGTRWAYEDNAGDRRLKTITNAGAARSFDFKTTPESRITGITERVGTTAQRTWTYGYDDVDRLISAKASTGQAYAYDYDEADNLTNINGVAAAYNDANQLVTLGQAGFTYDANGNLLDDGARTYKWDVENQLIGIGYKASPTKSTVFRYDGLGRRLAIVESNGAASAETRYLWCGTRLCQARNAADAVIRRYFPEGEVIPQGGTHLYYGVDQLGSVRDVSAAQTGTRVASYDYDPYGNVIAGSGRISVDFRYARMFYHPQSGLYLTNYRAYDPKSARWLSRDPIAEAGGLNLYSYVGGRPIGELDRSGLTPALAYPIIQYGIAFGVPLLIGAVNYCQQHGGEIYKWQTSKNEVSGDDAPAASSGADAASQSNSAAGDASPPPDDNDEGRRAKDNEPASEKTAKDMAKRIERDLGKDARRAFHDAKQDGAGDRTLGELKSDARDLYINAGKKVPEWLK